MRADEIEIGRPCPIDLRERIAAASAEFHCDHCDKPVHVLSHMSEAEAASVLARRQREDLCVALLRTGDGRVHFRGAEESLIPAARLAGPRRMLRASALALSMAACSGDDQRIEPLAVDEVEQPSVSERSLVVPGNPTHGVTPSVTRAEQVEQVEQFEVLAGAPPRLDEAEKEPCPPEQPLQVSFEQLEPLRTPEPPRQRMLATDAGLEGGDAQIEISYCVDEDGLVTDAKRVRGDQRLVGLFIVAMRQWRFKPHKVDGRKTFVCTTQRIIVRFDHPPA